MRTTIDLPDGLLRSARKRAADEGTTLTALLADGLRLRLGERERSTMSERKLPVSKLTGGMHSWIDPASNASIYDADEFGNEG
jgi:hypothetical protein